MRVQVCESSELFVPQNSISCEREAIVYEPGSKADGKEDRKEKERRDT